LNSKELLTSAESKLELFAQRFKVIHQRTLRHDLFSPCMLSQAGSGRKKFQLKPIEYLLSNTANVEETIVLGMISQLKEGKFYLEDLTGCLPLSLTDTKYHSGIYTEGCFVLAEGCLLDGVFHVKALGFPPAEVESVTRYVNIKENKIKDSKKNKLFTSKELILEILTTSEAHLISHAVHQ